MTIRVDYHVRDTGIRARLFIEDDDRWPDVLLAAVRAHPPAAPATREQMAADDERWARLQEKWRDEAKRKR